MKRYIVTQAVGPAGGVVAGVRRSAGTDFLLDPAVAADEVARGVIRPLDPETPDFAGMSKVGLDKWAAERGLQLDRREAKEAMIASVEAAIADGRIVL